MTESTLRQAIYTWLSSVLSALWVGDLSERPDNKIAFVWHMEDQTRPATPILEARLSNESRIGRDSIGPVSNMAGHVGEQKMTGDREEMLYLTLFGPGAVDYLRLIRNATEDNALRATFDDDSFIVVECMPILDAHEFLDSMPEDRATMDLRLRFIDTWTTNCGGIIEIVNMDTEVDGVDTGAMTVNAYGKNDPVTH